MYNENGVSLKYICKLSCKYENGTGYSFSSSTRILLNFTFSGLKDSITLRKQYRLQSFLGIDKKFQIPKVCREIQILKAVLEHNNQTLEIGGSTRTVVQ